VSSSVARVRVVERKNDILYIVANIFMNFRDISINILVIFVVISVTCLVWIGN